MTNKTRLRSFILGLTLASASLATTVQAVEQASLYDRLGGYNAIVAVVDDLVLRLAKDEQLGRFWEHRGEDGIQREKQLIVDFIANKAGGQLYYTGREMKLSHKGMRISEKDWDILMKHLNATLDKFALAPKERQDVIDFIVSTKDDMVELP
jgi:hemoglobin